jgi:hypothetical protein
MNSKYFKGLITPNNSNSIKRISYYFMCRSFILKKRYFFLSSSHSERASQRFFALPCLVGGVYHTCLMVEILPSIVLLAAVCSLLCLP